MSRPFIRDYSFEEKAIKSQIFLSLSNHFSEKSLYSPLEFLLMKSVLFFDRFFVWKKQRKRQKLLKHQKQKPQEK